jgi:hypothetical protein
MHLNAQGHSDLRLHLEGWFELMGAFGKAFGLAHAPALALRGRGQSQRSRRLSVKCLSASALARSNTFSASMPGAQLLGQPAEVRPTSSRATSPGIDPTDTLLHGPSRSIVSISHTKIDQTAATRCDNPTFADWHWEAKSGARLPAYLSQAMKQAEAECIGSNKRPRSS